MKTLLALFVRPLGIFLVGFILALYGCGGAPDTPPESSQEEEHDHEHAEGEDHEHEHEEGEDHDHEHAEEGNGHHHEAPHGGTLVAIGDHFAHLEVVLDSEIGKMTVYVLDGEAENPVRLKQQNMEFSMALKGADGVTNVIMLEATPVENTLTGETVGDTSEFVVESEQLKGVDQFSAAVSTLEIKGETVADVEFDFPEGNE
jgi:hypothetical protein